MKKLYLAGILFLTPCLWGEDQVQQSDSMVADENSDNYGSRRHRRVHDDEADAWWWDGNDGNDRGRYCDRDDRDCERDREQDERDRDRRDDDYYDNRDYHH